MTKEYFLIKKKKSNVYKKWFFGRLHPLKNKYWKFDN